MSHVLLITSHPHNIANYREKASSQLSAVTSIAQGPAHLSGSGWAETGRGERSRGETGQQQQAVQQALTD